MSHLCPIAAAQVGLVSTSDALGALLGGLPIEGPQYLSVVSNTIGPIFMKRDTEAPHMKVTKKGYPSSTRESHPGSRAYTFTAACTTFTSLFALWTKHIQDGGLTTEQRV